MALRPSTEMASSVPLVNGHPSSPTESEQRNNRVFSDSESELSEPIDPPIPSVSPMPHPNNKNGEWNGRSSTVEQEDAVGSDDADYDMDVSIQQEEGRSSHRSSSDESIRPAKRKAPVDDEEFIRNNPDLYGLRRSHRARPSRPMIDDSSDDQDSDSDIVPRPRKRLRPASRHSSKPATPAIETPDDSDGSDGYAGV